MRLPVTGFNGLYEVSDSGEVISLSRTVNGPKGPIQLKERVLSAGKHNLGYLKVTLSDSGNKQQAFVHRLVAEAFIPNPSGLPQVNHKDKDKSNNSVSNLEWCDSQYNNEHSCARTYELISPTGEAVTIYNLVKFCRENGLNAGNMCQVAIGKKSQYKGWRM